MIYTAFFVDKKELDSILSNVRGNNGLEKPIMFPHITTKFRPDKVDTALFGETLTVFLDGYGINETNEGFHVSFETDDPRLQAEINKIFAGGSVPHITTSISADGKAVNTRYLDFQPIKPIPMKVVFGGFSSGHPVF